MQRIKVLTPSTKGHGYSRNIMPSSSIDSGYSKGVGRIAGKFLLDLYQDTRTQRSILFSQHCVNNECRGSIYGEKEAINMGNRAH